jgi:hypothetical protein
MDTCGWSDEFEPCDQEPALVLELPQGRCAICTEHAGVALLHALQSGLSAVRVARYVEPRETIAIAGKAIPVGKRR